MAQILNLNTIFSNRETRILGVVIWEFEGEKSNWHGDGKANVW